jgi:prepilin-type N-terminal cleavage/methylation domain-containing protein
MHSKDIMKAKTHLSQNKSRGGFTLVEMLVVIGMIAALAGISFPVYKSIQKKVEKQQVQMMWSSLERAVDNFETEYNYLPYPGTAYPANEADLGGAQITSFTTVLAGGYSATNTANFKGITFLESGEPKGEPGNYTSGFLITGSGLTKTATLYTPWGGEYGNIRLDYNMDGLILHPYSLRFGPHLPPVSNTILFDIGADDVWITDDDFCTCRKCSICENIW